MFDSLFNNSSSSASAASVPSAPAVSDPESVLFNTLFAMPINTIQDFPLFEDESSFDYPLFGGSATTAKTMKTAQMPVNNLNFFNPLCTPQTPSLDLVAGATSAPVEGLGFDGCALFLDDTASMNQHSLIDTPFTALMDTPMLIDTPLETPFLGDFEAISDAAAPGLFEDFSFDFALGIPATVEPQQMMVPTPTTTQLSSPAESVDNDFSDDDEFVPSRSAALVSGLKRKSDASFEDVKKPRIMDPALKKAAAPKRFSCIHLGCDKSFARLFNLHTHEKTHDPEKARPFLCSDMTCGKSFSRKHDLQRHEASVHKGERNFVCETCTKSFARQDGLRRHLAVKGPCFNNHWSAT